MVLIITDKNQQLMTTTDENQQQFTNTDNSTRIANNVFGCRCCKYQSNMLHEPAETIYLQNPMKL